MGHRTLCRCMIFTAWRKKAGWRLFADRGPGDSSAPDGGGAKFRRTLRHAIDSATNEVGLWGNVACSLQKILSARTSSMECNNDRVAR
jgi:hypothetical protein